MCRRLSSKAWVFMKMHSLNFIHELRELYFVLQGSGLGLPKPEEVLAQYFAHMVARGSRAWTEITGGGDELYMPERFAQPRYWKCLLQACSSTHKDALTRPVHVTGPRSPEAGGDQ